jgi:hypothetical protein
VVTFLVTLSLACFAVAALIIVTLVERRQLRRRLLGDDR